MELIEKIREMVMEGEDEQVVDLVTQALQQNIKVGDIVNDGLIGAMNVVGPKMASGELFVPEVLMCAQAMQAGLAVLKPLLNTGDITSQGKMIIGTVKGDLHDIGKNLVAMMLESSGFDVIDLGIDQPIEAFIAAAKEHKPDLIGLSALLTTTMPAMQETVKALKEGGITAKILVGGAPVSEEFAKQIGADGYCSDAAETVILSKSLLN